MPSNAARGQYYKQRTKEWLEARGYAVAHLERMHMLRPPMGGAPPVWSKQDQLGADLLAVNVAHVLFVQVKMGGATWQRRGLSEARKKFEEFPVPVGSEQWICVWEPGARSPFVWRRSGTESGVSEWQEPLRQSRLRLTR